MSRVVPGFRGPAAPTTDKRIYTLDRSPSFAEIGRCRCAASVDVRSAVRGRSELIGAQRTKR